MRNHLLALIAVVVVATSQSKAQDQSMTGSNSSNFMTRPAADKCLSGRDDYYERTLQNLLSVAKKDKSKRTLPVAMMEIDRLRNPHINPLCIEASLAQVSGGPPSKDAKSKLGYTFRSCIDGKLKDESYEPCASPNYTKMIHHSFEIVATCMKDYVSESSDPKTQGDWVETYFELITKESGLHANVKSWTSAMGSAQLTGIYRTDFKNESLADVRQHLKNSKNRYCNSLGETVVSPARAKMIDDECTLLSVDAGPITGFLVGFSHLKHIKTQIVKTLNAYPKQMNQLSNEERSKLERTLVTISYNTGFPVVLRTLDYVLSNSKTAFQSDDQLVNKVVANINGEYRTIVKGGKKKSVWVIDNKGLRPAEISSYLSGIEKRYRDTIQDARRLQRDQFPDDRPLTTCRMK